MTETRCRRRMWAWRTAARAVGGRIVGEVLTTLIDRDLGSFRAAAPDWTPTLPTDQPGRFGLAHLLLVTTDGA